MTWTILMILSLLWGCRQTKIPEEPSPNMWVCCYTPLSFKAEEEFIKPTSLDGVEYACQEANGDFVETKCDISVDFINTHRCELSSKRYVYYMSTADFASYDATEAYQDSNGKNFNWTAF